MAIDRNAVNWFGRCKYVVLTCLFVLLVQTQTAFGQVDSLEPCRMPPARSFPMRR